MKVIAVDEETGSVRVSLKQMTQSERKKAFRHKPIDPTDIDFRPLAEALPEWIKEENSPKEDQA